MRKKIISFCIATLIAITHVYGGVVLTVPDVNITQGGTSNVVIYFDLGTQPYTAFQFDIKYPDGITSEVNDNGNPQFFKGDCYTEGHLVSSIHTSNGKDRFQCFSVNSIALTAQSGTLLIIPIKAQKTMGKGTYKATIDPIEFVQTDGTPDRPEPITFNINVTSSVVLDEESTVEPAVATDVNVIVKRTVKADEWSTICLPFEMTEEEVKAAFGNDVKLGDFKGYVTEEDENNNIVGITVNFVETTSIEANHPYIIKVSADVSEFSVEGVNIVPSDEPKVAAVTRTKRQWSEMIGTYVAQTVLEEYMLFLNDNMFWYSAGKTKMKAYRAYFDFYDVLSNAESGNTSASINLTFDDGATDIITTTSHNISNGHFFDLQGRRVEKPSKGVYICDGKKVIIK